MRRVCDALEDAERVFALVGRVCGSEKPPASATDDGAAIRSASACKELDRYADRIRGCISRVSVSDCNKADKKTGGPTTFGILYCALCASAYCSGLIRASTSAVRGTVPARRRNAVRVRNVLNNVGSLDVSADIVSSAISDGGSSIAEVASFLCVDGEPDRDAAGDIFSVHFSSLDRVWNTAQKLSGAWRACGSREDARVMSSVLSCTEVFLGRCVVMCMLPLDMAREMHGTVPETGAAAESAFVDLVSACVLRTSSMHGSLMCEAMMRRASDVPSTHRGATLLRAALVACSALSETDAALTEVPDELLPLVGMTPSTLVAWLRDRGKDSSSDGLQRRMHEIVFGQALRPGDIEIHAERNPVSDTGSRTVLETVYGPLSEVLEDLSSKASSSYTVAMDRDPDECSVSGSLFIYTLDHYASNLCGISFAEDSVVQNASRDERRLGAVVSCAPMLIQRGAKWSVSLMGYCTDPLSLSRALVLWYVAHTISYSVRYVRCSLGILTTDFSAWMRDRR